MTRVLGLAALCAALTPVPLLRATPGFARAPLDWLLLLAGGLVLALLMAGLGALCFSSSRRRGAVVALGLWGLGLLGLSGVAGSARPPAPAHPLVLIGVDGAGWPQIDRLRAEGRLPTLEKLLARGVRAELETLSPVISPPIWTSIATGLPPERHGVVDFWTSSEAVRAKRLWEVADEHGLVSGVFGYLVTWPPRKRGGFLVPGFLAGDTRTLPPELEFVKRLERRSAGNPAAGSAVADYWAALRHGATLASFRSLVVESFSDAAGDEKRLGILALETDIFCGLLRRQSPELAIFYQHHVDAVSHLFYQYFEPDSFDAVIPDDVRRLGGRIPSIYEATDASIARILECAAPHANVVIVSDHGQRAAARAGRPFWVLRSETLLRGLGIADRVRATNLGEVVFVRAASAEVDMQEVARRLRSVVTEPGGHAVLQVLPRGDRELHLRAARPPLRGERARLGEALLPTREIVHAAGRRSGEHTERALLLMAGPDVVPGARLEGASVLDVAPTVWALLRLPVADDLAGRVLRETLRPGLEVARVESYGAPEGGAEPGEPELDAWTRKRLEALGYIR